MFWNYVKNKRKNKKNIGYLSFINNLGVEEIISNDSTKAAILN